MNAARAVAIATLTVFGWACWALSVLFVVYVALAVWAGDPRFKIAYLAAASATALVAGFACRRLAARVRR